MPLTHLSKLRMSFLVISCKGIKEKERRLEPHGSRMERKSFKKWGQKSERQETGMNLTEYGEIVHWLL